MQRQPITLFQRRPFGTFLAISSLASSLGLIPFASSAFEGQIQAVDTYGGPSVRLLYTVATNFILIEPTATNSTSAVNLVDVNAGTITLIHPQNRTFIRFKTSMEDASGLPPGIPGATEPASPPPPPPPPPPSPQRPTGPAAGMAPGGLPPGIGPTNFAGLPGNPQMPARPQMPQRPAMPAMPAGGVAGGMPARVAAARLELRATGQTTNLLGYTCQGYEIKRHGETMEIWATDQLWPFQGYLVFQPRSFGPPMIEERWSAMIAARKLFPLLATLRMDNGAERYRFEVLSIKPAKLTEEQTNRFIVPPGYVEIMARPF